MLGAIWEEQAYGNLRVEWSDVLRPRPEPLKVHLQSPEWAHRCGHEVHAVGSENGRLRRSVRSDLSWPPKEWKQLWWMRASCECYRKAMMVFLEMINDY